jgi:hypothetical protein
MMGGGRGLAAAPPGRRRHWLAWLLAIALTAEVAAGPFGLGYLRAAGRPGTLLVDVAEGPRVAARCAGCLPTGPPRCCTVTAPAGWPG